MKSVLDLQGYVSNTVGTIQCQMLLLLLRISFGTHFCSLWDYRGPQGSGYHLAALSRMAEPSEEFGHVSDAASYRSIESDIHPGLDSKHTKEAEWAQLLSLH